MTQDFASTPKPCYAFYQDQLLLRRVADPAEGMPAHRIPLTDELPDGLPTAGTVHEFSACGSTEIAAATSLSQPLAGNDEWAMVGLRASYDIIDLPSYLTAGKAFQLLHWDSHSRYCPVCGTATRQEAPIMKKCPQCGHEIYPPISTAIIVRISRGDEILLVHARNFRGTFYGLVAGFLEPGETLEQCVEREVMEETGLRVKNIRYFASQPWPYPSGLMCAFTADYAGGEIKLQADELSAGAFYSRHRLPEIPQKLSIARRLIDDWLATT